MALAKKGIQRWSVADKDGKHELFNKKRSSWSFDGDDGYLTVYGELYNPTDILVTSIEFRLWFEMASNDYILAVRHIELDVYIPPGESRPIRFVPEPKIDALAFPSGPDKIHWDYQVVSVGGKEFTLNMDEVTNGTPSG